MASNEDILMQFTAEDNVTGVVEAMESSVTSALESITSAMDSMDSGLINLANSAESLSSSFGELESSFDSADISATSFQSTIDTLNGDNISNVASDVDELDNAFASAEGGADGLSSAMDSIDAGGISNATSEVEELGESINNTTGEASGQNDSALYTNMINDVESASNSIADLGKTALESASAAEQGWMTFGNAVNNTGGNWDSQSDSIKSWVKEYSNSMGRGVADTRSAMTTFMNMGLSLDQTQDTMQAVSNYAAQFGMSQSSAAQSIQMAFMGAGRSVKKLGLDIADFKDEAGNVDKEKLLAAIMEKTSGAADKYADTYEARVQRMNNAINSLKTDFGKEIMNTIEPLIPVVQSLFNAFSGLPQPVKSAILAFGGLAGGVAMVAGPLIKMRAYINMGGGLGSLTKGLSVAKAAFSALAGGEGISGAIKALKEFSTVSKSASAASTVTSTMGNSTIPNIDTSTLSKNTTTVVRDAETVGALAPEAEAAGAGITATGGALSSISAAFTSMIVPLLAIAAVVAVMIPIIAGLAAEALVFIKGIQVLIDALDFDSIDLTGAIDGIKQVGQALLEVGVAMGEMTFANIMTGLAVLTTGIPGLINPIQIAGQMLVQAADELQVFKTVQIDSSIPSNIKSISQSLKLVSDAMTSLTSVVLNMAVGNLATLGGLLGDVNTAISTAKDEITHAANEIATFKDLPNIDDGAVDKLKSVSSSLESVADAMDALRSLRDSNNFDISGFVGGLFGGVDITSAINAVKTDIYKAASSLSVFKDLPSIDNSVSTKLKNVSSALKSVADSIESLRSLRDDYNWDSAMGNIFKGVDIPTVINNIRSTLYRVSASLRTLNDMSAIPEGTGQKIQRVAWTTNNVVTAYNSLKSLNSKVNGGADLGNVLTTINTANRVIRQVATRLASLSSIANIPEGLGSKISAITKSTKQLSGSVSAIQGVPQVPDGAGEKVRKAISSVKTIAKQLNGLSGSSVAGNISQVLTSVRRALSQLKTTLSQSTGGFKSSGVRIGSNIKSGVNQGLSNLSGSVRNRVNSATSSGASAAWTGGARMGSSATRGFQSAFKISSIASSEVVYATQAIQNGTGSFVQAVGEMADKAVTEAKNKLDQHSPGKIARMWGDEMGFSTDMVQSRGANLVSTIRGITQSAITAGTGSLNMGSAFSTDMTSGRLNAINSMNQTSSMGKSQRPVSIMVGEGAVQLDARNLTTQESRQVMINAIEGLDMVTGVDVKGE